MQVDKHRENGKVTDVELRVIYGAEEQVLASLGKSTAKIEWTHLTMRHSNGRLVRRCWVFPSD